MQISTFILKKIWLSASILVICILTFCALNSTEEAVYDERNFISNLDMYDKHGLDRYFIENIQNQSPGPLFQMVHGFLKPITKYKLQYMRLVNVCLLILIILVMYFINKIEGNEEQWYNILSLLFLPLLWPIAGMALTEIPAMFCAALGLCLLFYSLRVKNMLLSIVICCVGAFFQGMSLWGRIPFLMISVVCFISVFISQSNTSRLLLLIYAIISIIIFLPLYFIWGGSVPPATSYVSSGGITIWHGVLAFAYSSIIILIIDPYWFKFKKLQIVYLVAALIALFIINYFYGVYRFTPMSGVAWRFLSPGIVEIYSTLMPCVFLIIACLNLYSLALLYFNNIKNIYLSISIASYALVLCSCALISAQFSSRYVAQASFLMVLFMLPQAKLDLRRMIYSSIGIVAGFLMLNSYY